jgi:hypothetical protein
LQDEAGRRRVLFARSPLRASPGRRESIPRLPARQPLVNELDLEADSCQLRPEGPRRGRLRPLAAVHVARQPEHDPRRTLRTRQRSNLLQVPGAAPAQQHWTRECLPGLLAADRYPDAPAAVVQADDGAH